MKIGKRYFIYLLLSVFVVLMLEVYISFSDLKQELIQEKAYLNVTLSKLKKEKENIIRLKEKTEELKIKPLSKEEALRKILEDVDYFVRMYDAKITKPLVEENSTFVISVSFDYYPENSEDLLELLTGLNKQVLPQIVIENFRLNNLKEGTKIYFEITLKQPFKGQI